MGGGSALLVVNFSVLVRILLCSWSISGAALSTRLRGRCVTGDPVHDLVSTRGQEWLATCVPIQDVLSQGILGSRTTCGISGCSEEPACYCHLVVIFTLLKQVNFPHFFNPSTLSSGS